MPPTVSVLIATYNNARFIEECIDSVLAQDLVENFELIILDSASTDETVEVANQKLVSSVIDFHIIVDGKNRFWEGSQYFLDALYLCKGEFIAFLDGDDSWLSKNKLQKQLDYLRANPEIFLVSTCAEVWSHEKQQNLRVIPKISEIVISPGRALAWDNFIINSSVMMRNELDKLEQNFYAMSLHKDYALWAQLLRDSYFATLPLNYTRYRIDTGQNITQSNSAAFRKAIDTQTRALLALHPDEETSHLWLSSIFDDLHNYLVQSQGKPIYSQVFRKIVENQVRTTQQSREIDDK